MDYSGRRKKIELVSELVSMGIGDYSKNVILNPIPSRDIIEHAGEFCGRSIDGSKILGYSSTLSGLTENIKRDYGISDLSLVVISVVE